MENKLTLRQGDVLAAIGKFHDENGFGISYSELAEAIGVRSVNTVALHVRALEKKGFITHTLGKQRSLRTAKR